MRLCRLCNERPVSAARLKAHDYRCNRCRGRSASHRAASARYGRTPARRAANAERNQFRIFVGKRYHSVAASREQAALVNAHIKGRLNAFKGQSAGAEVEGVASDAVRVYAEMSAD